MTRKRGEDKFYGAHACRVLVQRRQQDVIRVYVLEKLLHEWRPLLKWCAENKKAYHVVSEAELEKVAGSSRHDGICILAPEPPVLAWDEFCEGPLKQSPSEVWLLDGVANPHNFGSILRIAAHFGVHYIISDGQLRASPAAYRVAEGGAEFVATVQAPSLTVACEALKRSGYSVWGTAAEKGLNLYDLRAPSRLAVVFGGERHGLRPELRSVMDVLVRVPGSGQIESLNVATAAAVVAGEVWRQRHN